MVWGRERVFGKCCNWLMFVPAGVLGHESFCCLPAASLCTDDVRAATDNRPDSVRWCSFLSQEPAWMRPRVLKFKLESCGVLTSCSVLSVAPRPHHPCRSGSLPDEYWQDSPTFSVNQDSFALARGTREKIYSQSRGVALTHTHTHCIGIAPTWTGRLQGKAGRAELLLAGSLT